MAAAASKGAFMALNMPDERKAAQLACIARRWTAHLASHVSGMLDSHLDSQQDDTARSR